MDIKAIFIDFDGVLRHWQSSTVKAAEVKNGIKPGMLFSFAFDEKFLLRAITGEITHEQWQINVCNELSQIYGKATARLLISAWSMEEWSVDFELLNCIRQIAPSIKRVLVTNATTQLKADIQKSNLDSEFDIIVNSSAIGVAKPDVKFFSKALSLSDSRANEVLYIDDSIDNVAAAVGLGIDSICHRSVGETINIIKQRCGGL